MKGQFKLIGYVFATLLFFIACNEETKNKIKEVKQGVNATTTLVKEANTIQNDIEKLRSKTPISNQELKKWLPQEVAGLRRTGFKVGQVGYMKVNSVEGTYKTEESKKKISIAVIDGAGPVGSVMAPSYGLIGSIDAETEDENKHQQNVSVNGIKAKQTFYKKRNNTQLMFLFEKRFLVTVNSTDMNPKETWKAVQQFQLNKLADQAE